MSKVWVYVSDKHDPEVYARFEDARLAIFKDSRWDSWEELVEKGYVYGSESEGSVSVEDIGHITEVDFND